MGIEGFFDFISMIKDFLLSLVDGLLSFFETILVIFNLSSASINFLPTTVFAFLGVACTLIILLRVVGR